MRANALHILHWRRNALPGQQRYIYFTQEVLLVAKPGLGRGLQEAFGGKPAEKQKILILEQAQANTPVAKFAKQGRQLSNVFS